MALLAEAYVRVVDEHEKDQLNAEPGELTEESLGDVSGETGVNWNDIPDPTQRLPLWELSDS